MMKKFIFSLLLLVFACVSFSQAQTVIAARFLAYSASTGTIAGALGDTLDASSATITQDFKMSLFTLTIGGVNYIPLHGVWFVNNSGNGFSAGDTIKLGAELNGVLVSNSSIVLDTAMPAGDTLLALLDPTYVLANCIAGYNSMCFKVTGVNNNAVTDAGGACIYLKTGSVSVEANALEAVKVYPNPVRNALKIENVENANISIYNVAGQLVESIKDANGNLSVDMSNHAAGLYFVKMQNGTSVRTEKIQVIK